MDGVAVIAGGKLLLAPAGVTLQGNQDHHEHKHGGGDLGRSAQVAQVHPGIEQAQGEGLYGKEVDGAEVVQGFHQHQ